MQAAKYIDPVIGRLEGINYFKPHSVKEANSVVPEVNKILNSYLREIEQFREYDGGSKKLILETAYKNAEKTLLNIMKDNGVRQDVLEKCKNSARRAAHKAAYKSVEDTAWGIEIPSFSEGLETRYDEIFKKAHEIKIAEFDSWTTWSYPHACEVLSRSSPTLKNIMDYAEKYMVFDLVYGEMGLESNPIESVMKLYEMGLKPTNFRHVSDSLGCEGYGGERFVVDILIHNRYDDLGNFTMTPLTDNPKEFSEERPSYVFGCLAHGDEQINWIHGTKESQYCLGLKPVKQRVVELYDDYMFWKELNV